MNNTNLEHEKMKSDVMSIRRGLHKSTPIHPHDRVI